MVVTYQNRSFSWTINKMGSKMEKIVQAHFRLRWAVLRAHFRISIQILVVTYQNRSFSWTIKKIESEVEKIIRAHFWFRWAVLRAHFKISYQILVVIYQNKLFSWTINKIGSEVEKIARTLFFKLKTRSLVNCVGTDSLKKRNILSDLGKNQSFKQKKENSNPLREEQSCS